MLNERMEHSRNLRLCSRQAEQRTRRGMWKVATACADFERSESGKKLAVVQEESEGRSMELAELKRTMDGIEHESAL